MLRQMRSWSHEWLRIAGALGPLTATRAAGKATMRSGRWEGQYKLLGRVYILYRSCALRQY